MNPGTLQVALSAADRRSLTDLVGGSSTLAALESGSAKPATVAGAVLQCLRVSPRHVDSTVRFQPVMVALLLLRAAMGGDAEQRPAIARQLQRLGRHPGVAWREVNLRLASYLYAYLRSADFDRTLTARVVREAESAWAILEAAPGVPRPAEERSWRGKRAYARLLLSRRTGDDEVVLRGAVDDLAIAESRGDHSPQHFRTRSEVEARLARATGEVTWAEQSYVTLTRLSEEIRSTPELQAALAYALSVHADLLLASAGRSAGTNWRTALLEAQEALPSDLSGALGVATPAGATHGETSDAVEGERLLRAVLVHLDRAVDDPRATAASLAVWRVRRGSALLRAAGLGAMTAVEPPAAVIALVRDALADLRLVAVAPTGAQTADWPLAALSLHARRAHLSSADPSAATLLADVLSGAVNYLHQHPDLATRELLEAADAARSKPPTGPA